MSVGHCEKGNSRACGGWISLQVHVGVLGVSLLVQFSVHTRQGEALERGFGSSNKWKLAAAEMRASLSE